MKTNDNRPPKSLNEATSKIQKKSDEMTAFYHYLNDKVTSCTDAAVMLNIPQKNLTRYKRELEKVGKLQVVKMQRCPHTGRWVQHITTDPKKFSPSSQYQIPFS